MFHVSVMSNYVLVSTFVTLMDTILFLRIEVCFLSLYLWGLFALVFVPNYYLVWFVSMYQQFVLNISLFFVHIARTNPTFDMILMTCVTVDFLKFGEEIKVVTYFPFGEPAEGS